MANPPGRRPVPSRSAPTVGADDDHGRLARPASQFDSLALLQVVREVAEAAAVDEPQTISTRAWDAARPLSERHVDAPAARRIAEHLGVPWRTVIELAFVPVNGRGIALGHALNDKQGDWLTPEYSDFVLRLVARRLQRPTLTPGEYRAERATMLAADRGRQLRIPTEEQLAAHAGSWDRALAHAGLRARQGRGGQRARVGPASIVDVLDRCYEHHRAEPTSKELAVFAKANGIPYPRRTRPWSDYLREWKDVRRTRGLPVPDGPPPKAQRPDYSQDVGAARPGERRGKKRWDDVDEVIDWVTRYLRQLRRGETASQRGYNAWAREQDGAPWSAAFNQHGGWDAVRDAAQTGCGAELERGRTMRRPESRPRS